MSSHPHYKNTCPACKNVSQCRCMHTKIETSIVCRDCASKGFTSRRNKLDLNAVDVYLNKKD
jgi:hypothetical protein